MAAASVGGVASTLKVRKKGRRAKAQTQGSPQGDNVPVVDQTLTARREPKQTPSTASAAVVVQDEGGARACQGPVAEVDSDILLRGPSHHPANDRQPLAVSTVHSSTRGTCD